MIREEVERVFQEQAIQKVVTLDTKFLEALAIAVEIAQSQGYKKLNGIDTSEMLEKIVTSAHQKDEQSK